MTNTWAPMFTGKKIFIDKSLSLCGFLVATALMQHYKKLWSTKGFYAWGENIGQKMQGYFSNARLQNVQRAAAVQGVAAGGCVLYPVIARTGI